MLSYLIVCPLMFLAGLVDSIAGGGGLISLPAFLLAGVPAHTALGTNNMASAMGTTVSTGRFLKNGSGSNHQEWRHSPLPDSRAWSPQWLFLFFCGLPIIPEADPADPPPMSASTPTHAARRCSLHSGFRQSVLCHILSKINVRSFVSMYPHDHCAVPAGTRVTQQKGRAIQNNRSPDENFMLGGLAVNCEALRRPVRAPPS